MDKLPLDIIIHHIIPYTYNIQPKVLLEDIRNYVEMEQRLLEWNNTNWVKRELLSILYMKQKATRIWSRRFLKNSNYTSIYQYSINTQFRILFGLFTKEERIRFVEHIVLCSQK